MEQVVCPGCGAPIAFKSSASVLAVCEFCKTAVLKDADSVRDLGKMSEVLEDYSPIQINTSGVYRGHAFSVVGRLQLRYDAGFWNEWYILYDSGEAAWLSDASGQYTITTEKAGIAPLPAFETLRPGAVTAIGHDALVAADIRSASCTGGQGELPFQVGAGYAARVADFRHLGQFVTLDYSDGDIPRVYVGEAVSLDGLQCQLLRAPETIMDSAGRFRGKVEALNCPSCGGSMNFSPGLTTHGICPHCQSALDLSGKQAEVIAAGQRVASVKTTLELGAHATIDGQAYVLMGLMVRQEQDDGTRWTEYLLYSAKRGFLWLVETSEGWQRASVLDQWPARDAAGAAVVANKPFGQLYSYVAQVVFAIGSFNWRVTVGDSNHVIEFGNGGERLAAEVDRAELTWSYSAPVPPAKIGEWFGLTGANVPTVPIAGKLTSSARTFLIALLCINAIPFFLNPGATFVYVAIAAAAIYIPAVILETMSERSGT